MSFAETGTYGPKHFSLAWSQIKDDFSEPLFIGLFASLVAFVVWSNAIQKDNTKVRRAGRIALITFIIGYFSRLDLVFTAVILVTFLALIGFAEFKG